jgi:hypothetical protein
VYYATIMRRLPALTLGLVLASSACGGDDDDDDDGGEEGVPKIDCNAALSAGIPKYSELAFLQTVCVTCHSSQLTTQETRRNADPLVNYDTYTAAKEGAPKGVQEAYEGGMPPPRSGVRQLTESERIQFNTWASCGMPE